MTGVGLEPIALPSGLRVAGRPPSLETVMAGGVLPDYLGTGPDVTDPGVSASWLQLAWDGDQPAGAVLTVEDFHLLHRDDQGAIAALAYRRDEVLRWKSLVDSALGVRVATVARLFPTRPSVLLGISDEVVAMMVDWALVERLAGQDDPATTDDGPKRLAFESTNVSDDE